VDGGHPREGGRRDRGQRVHSPGPGAVEARDAAAAARRAGQSALDAAVLQDAVTRYRQLAAAGLAARPRSSSTALEDAGVLCKDSLTSWSSSPTCLPPPNGITPELDALRQLFTTGPRIPRAAPP
jgi:hypothetical protein